MGPLVSIITPSYNQGRFIRETIESVFAQDYKNIEYIIIDGGSTDNSLDIIKEYEGRLTYISEKDRGQSDAINKGFKMAHGDIVAWLNSDDVYEPDCVSKAVAEFRDNPNLGLVYGEGYIIDEDSNKIRVFENTQDFDYWKLVNFWDYIMQPTTFFRAEYLRKVGYLDENLHYCMDWDLWIKLSAISEVKYIPELMACSREYNETKTSTGGEARLEEIISLLKRHSGKCNPPGIASYRASTFYTRHTGDIWPIRKLAGLYLTCKHRWLNMNLPVKYADGCIGKRYVILVPKYVGAVRILVDVTEARNLPQQVSLYLNDEKIQTYRMTKCGVQEFGVQIRQSDMLNELCLVCKRGSRRGNGDCRWRALRIKDIVFERKS